MTRDTLYRWFAARLITMSHVYFAIVFGWATLHFLFGDRWAWLFLLNAFALYLFLPLPAIFALAFVTRQRETWIGALFTLALAVFLYGDLFVPKIAPTHPPRETLTVMTYNMLASNSETRSIIRTIRLANADVVAFQEFNPLAAEAITRDLIDEYPYQVLAPAWDVSGMGIISRHPLYANGDTLPSEWVAAPQVLTLDWHGTRTTILNVHPKSTNYHPQDFLFAADQIEWTIRERERDVQVVAKYGESHLEPIIVLGDFNATDQNQVYQIMTRVFRDSWREAGWGLGHTWPALDPVSQSHIAIAGVPLPTFLVRIDYIFHSRHWRATSAAIGPWDGQSDHRPVIVRLVLEKP